MNTTGGKIFTFYSYKGGTGRTMALANVACLLAQRQATTSEQGILMIDWDLEAPCLHRFFRNRLKVDSTSKDNKDQATERLPGLIDLFCELWKLISVLKSQQEITDTVNNLFADLGRFAIETTIPKLHLLKAGCFDDDYSERVNTFDWVRLYKHYPTIFQTFVDALSQQYAYTLIDSRTGITDTSGICTMLMPEKLILVFTPNRQSLTGCTELVRKATSYRKSSNDLRPLVVYPLISRVVASETTLVDNWRFGNREQELIGYQIQFQELFKDIYDLPESDLTHYFNEVQIQHIADYAFGEQIAVLVERGGDRLSLTRSYETFTDRTLSIAAPWETLPQTMQQPFMNDVYICYAKEDRPVAQTACTALEAAGCRCWIAPRDVMPGHTFTDAITEAIRNSRIMVVIFSAEANRSKFVIREVERALDNGNTIIPFRIEDVTPSGGMEFFLSLPQWLDAFTQPRDKAIQLLVRTVLLCLGNQPMVIGQPSEDIQRRDPAPTTDWEKRNAPPSSNATQRIAILYKRNAQPDEYVLQLLESRLSKLGHQVFIDRHLAVGVEWAREIERQICEADAVIPLLSATSIHSEMLSYEVQTAYEACEHQEGKPRLLPIRVEYEGPLPEELATILDPLAYVMWKSPQDDVRLLTELQHVLRGEEMAGEEPHIARSSPSPILDFDSVGGAVPLESPFYIARDTDREFLDALARRDSIVLVKGPRQMGKTSLLARGLQQARAAGVCVVSTDFQKLNNEDLSSPKNCYIALARLLARQLKVEISLDEVWRDRSSPNSNFEDYLVDRVLAKINGPMVWGLDEVDRLFTCDYGSEVFALFRAWHNERQLDPTGPWSDLTLAVAYATEAHLFITDLNQSPFNVGTRLELNDFTLDQVADLNGRYGSPLHGVSELARLYRLVGGHPYLVRRSLAFLVKHEISLSAFEDMAARDDGPVGDHLRRILVLVVRNAADLEALREVLCGRPCPTKETFYHLRSAGVIVGDTAHSVRLRCQLYATYLEQHLL